MAVFPEWFEQLLSTFTGGWEHVYTPGEYLTIIMLLLGIKFAVVRLILPDIASIPIRMINETDPGHQEVVSVSPVLTCNDHEAVLRSTLEGAGISSQALQVVADAAAWAVGRLT